MFLYWTRRQPGPVLRYDFYFFVRAYRNSLKAEMKQKNISVCFLASWIRHAAGMLCSSDPAAGRPDRPAVLQAAFFFFRCVSISRKQRIRDPIRQFLGISAPKTRKLVPLSSSDLNRHFIFRMVARADLNQTASKYLYSLFFSALYVPPWVLHTSSQLLPERNRAISMLQISGGVCSSSIQSRASSIWSHSSRIWSAILSSMPCSL